jgi:hypothetical protein
MQSDLIHLERENNIPNSTIAYVHRDGFYLLTYTFERGRAKLQYLGKRYEDSLVTLTHLTQTYDSAIDE